MFEREEVVSIIAKIKKDLNLRDMNLKDLTNALLLVEWNFITYTGYRLFNFQWTNNQSTNINTVKKTLIENGFKLKSNVRYETIEIENVDYKLSTYINKSIEELDLYEDFLNKSEFYFLNLLPFELAYYNVKSIQDIDLEKLVERKKNKEY